MHLLKTVLNCTAAVLMTSVLWADKPAQAQLAEPIVPPSPAGPLAAPGAPQIIDGRYAPPADISAYRIPGAEPRQQQPSEYQSTILEGCAERMACPYSASMDLLFMQLNRPATQALVIDENTGATLLSTGDLDFGMEPGARVRFSYMTDENSWFEMRYFGIYEWDKQAAVYGTNNLTTPDLFGAALADWHDADIMAADYRVRLNSVEANLIQTIENTTASCFFGLRYIRLDERFILTAVDGADASDYSVRTLNELIGIHAGARDHWCIRGWNLLGSFSFGLYGNHCRQTTLATYDARQFIERTFSPKRTGLAYTAEVNFDAIHTIWTNVFLHVGYNLLYVGNVARAPDQLDFTSNSLSGSRVLWREGALAHGPSVGIEARW